MSDYASIYEIISEEEFLAASDSSYSYFPCVSPGKNPETGKSEEIIDHYAKHKYVYGMERLDYD